LGEVREYLDDRLTRAARREFGRHQNAWARGDNDTVLASVVPGQQVASVVGTSKPKVITNSPLKQNTEDAKPVKLSTPASNLPATVKHELDGKWRARIGPAIDASSRLGECYSLPAELEIVARNKAFIGKSDDGEEISAELIGDDKITGFFRRAVGI
jgi:hypothetical protein